MSTIESEGLPGVSTQSRVVVSRQAFSNESTSAVLARV
jgi:hypothetical protein